ncbi:MAG TPA: hypothetical protein VF502_02475 [Stellaceae bacterium]
MSLSWPLPAFAVVALATAASPVAAAQPDQPYDRCAYMNHDSKAYYECVAQREEARLRAEATTPTAPESRPEPGPKPQAR